MLALQRKLRQRIVIQVGNDIIYVEYLKKHGSEQITLGVEAPAHVRIDREEVHIRKAQDQKEAT